MKKYCRDEHRLLAAWGCDCAERVLSLFEQAYSGDDRPRKAIEACRDWVRTGEFRMAVIRTASLSSHAAAREAGMNEAPRYAARAAGQAVAAAHVTQHTFGAAYYAMKAVAAASSANTAGDAVVAERDWQAGRLPSHLREEVMARLTVRVDNTGRVTVRLDKGGDF